MHATSTEIEQLCNEKELAAKLRVSLATVRKWRLEGSGPPFIKIGPMVRYRPADVALYLDQCPAIGGHLEIRA
jgi:hypothetical protein